MTTYSNCGLKIGQICITHYTFIMQHIVTLLPSKRSFILSNHMNFVIHCNYSSYSWHSSMQSKLLGNCSAHSRTLVLQPLEFSMAKSYWNCATCQSVLWSDHLWKLKFYEQCGMFKFWLLYQIELTSNFYIHVSTEHHIFTFQIPMHNITLMAETYGLTHLCENESCFWFR